MSGRAWLDYTTVPLPLIRVMWFYSAASWGGFILMSGPLARMAGRPGSAGTVDHGTACSLLHGGQRVTQPLKWQQSSWRVFQKTGNRSCQLSKAKAKIFAWHHCAVFCGSEQSGAYQIPEEDPQTPTSAIFDAPPTPMHSSDMRPG